MLSSGSLKRVVVVGCSGAGKSTFSAELARRLHLPYVERDMLGDLGSEAYQTAVAAALDKNEWVFDGPPYFVEDLVYSAAQVVVWLDYTRPLVMSRAIWRSLGRTFGPTEPGQDSWWRFRQWVTPGGPRWAWQTYSQRRQEFGKLSQRPEMATVQVVRFSRPRAARIWLTSLASQ